jgi:hypothetical protein
MTDVTSRGYPKNFRNLNGCNVYGVFDRHRHPTEDSPWTARGSGHARQAVRLDAPCGVGFSRSRTVENRVDATSLPFQA